MRDLYTRAAVDFIGEWATPRLDLLYNVQAANIANDLPSWVPDWSEAYVAKALGSVRSGLYTGGFDATNFALGAYPPVVSLPNLDDLKSNPEARPFLTARSVPLMTIRMVQETANAELALPYPDPYPITGEYYTDILTSVLFSPLSESFTRKPPQTRKFWHHVAECKRQGCSPHENTALQLLRRRGIPFDPCRFGFGEEQTLKDGRFLFISEHGLIGLAPRYTEVRRSHYDICELSDGARSGDQICLVFGSRIPFVLRPLENKNYKLIGECFVYGLMHGEATDGLNACMEKDFTIE